MDGQPEHVEVGWVWPGEVGEQATGRERFERTKIWTLKDYPFSAEKEHKRVKEHEIRREEEN